MTALDDISTHDLNFFLHDLRTRRLAQMPADGGVVLSGGAANQFYFDWFSEHYRGHVDRHIAVELFSLPPDPLPEGVEWLARTLGDLSPVKDDEVDLVFAGQVIEHLWPGDMASFLCEAHRVLRPGGALVLDSPTRFITAALGWTQPEHTIELEIDEIVELLGLAGFIDVDVKGIWLCYDRDQARTLPLEVFGGGDQWPWRKRIAEATDRPKDSFIWWAEARNDSRRGEAAAVRRRVREIYDQARPTYFERMRSEVGQPTTTESDRGFRAASGHPGLVLRGPSIAMPPGRHEAVFRLRAEAMRFGPGPHHKIAEVEVTRDGDQVVAEWSLTARNLLPGGSEREVVLPFELSDTAFNSELRVRSLGAAPLVASLPVAVHEGVGRPARQPCARATARDPARVYGEMAMGWSRRILGWPARRLLDPRVEGLRNHGQWVAATVSARIDARTNELGARIDRLAELVERPVAASTTTERSLVLPFVLSSLGSLTPGTTILVTGSNLQPVSTVLSTLGYDVETAPLPDDAPQVAAAVARVDANDSASVKRAFRAVAPGGLALLIAEESDHPRLNRLLSGWQIDEEAVTELEGPRVPKLVLLRASRSATVKDEPAE